MVTIITNDSLPRSKCLLNQHSFGYLTLRLIEKYCGREVGGDG